MIKQIIDDLYYHARRRLWNHKLLIKYRKQRLVIGRDCFLKRCRFGEYNRIYDSCHLVDVDLGDRTYISEYCRMYDVRFGKYCAVGPGVTIGLGIHPSKTFVSIHPLFYSKTNSASSDPLSDDNYFTEHLPVKVGHDVWIGAGVIVHDGVYIGNGAIIGSGAVVTKDVPSYAIVAGIPAKVLRYRFDPEQIACLEEFSWWDKESSWFKHNWKDFHNIDSFIEKHVSKNG